MRWQRAIPGLMLLLTVGTGATTGEWIDDIESGCAVWNPVPQPGETVKWTGDCEGDRALGHGVLRWWQNGIETQTAEGYFRSGKLEGLGNWSWASGHQYQGSFSAGKFEGKGVFI